MTMILTDKSAIRALGGPPRPSDDKLQKFVGLSKLPSYLVTNEERRKIAAAKHLLYYDEYKPQKGNHDKNTTKNA